jgi:2-aminoethanethiol dioxygenase/cysteine oxidase family protein
MCELRAQCIYGLGNHAPTAPQSNEPEGALQPRMSDNQISNSPQDPNEVEVFPGVYERRHFIRGSWAALTAIVLIKTFPRNVVAQGMKSANAASTDKLAWDDFLKQAVPVAQQLLSDPGFNFDEYLYRIGSLATRLREIPDSKLGPYTGVDPRVWFGPSYRGTPFFVIQWRMEPGAFLPPHNHPNASVCSLTFEGEVQLRNFEIIGEAPDYSSKKPFQIRETRSERMTAGRISTLSPIRDNIHCFQIGKTAARGIDINTFHPKSGVFSFLDMNDKPVDSEKRIFEVTWNPQLGQVPKKS